MVDAARQSPRFPWDCEVPDNAFWKDLDYQTSRAFRTSFTEAELSETTFDASVSKETKMKHLQSRLISKLDAKEAAVAPSLLREVDYNTWLRLKQARSGFDCDAGDSRTTEATLREIGRYKPDGTINIGVLHGLCFVLESEGRYIEAEEAAREVLPLVQGIPTRDTRDSPQAIGAMRILAKSIWKQKRYPKAQEWIDQCTATIDRMGSGQCAKYQEDERKQFKQEVVELETWRSQRIHDVTDQTRNVVAE